MSQRQLVRYAKAPSPLTGRVVGIWYFKSGNEQGRGLLSKNKKDETSKKKWVVSRGPLRE